MATPQPPEETPVFPSAGPGCDTCKKPDMSNMTWEDGAKNFFSTYFATPRMWPIGYILGSPYSPLRAEVEMPSKNWRNAFEDLLALKSGRGMIPEKDRKAEDEHTARKRFELASFSISECNHLLDYNKKLEASYLESRQWAVEHKEQHVVQTITNDLLPWIKSKNQRLIANAQRTKADYDTSKDWTASCSKLRGQWVASLITSGALPDWRSGMYNSTDGPVMAFSKRNSPPNLDASFSISELELQQVFEEGLPYDFRSPALLSLAATKALIERPHTTPKSELPNDPMERFRPSKSSIIHQSTECDLIKMPDGSIGPKAKIQTTLADGTTEAKEFEDNPVGVLEEIQGAHRSMTMMLGAVEKMLRGPDEPLKRAAKVTIGDESQVVSLPEG